MEYVRPPRGALSLLKVFAREPDFDIIIGDLSEEFQQRVSAFGQAAARRWYWREAIRNTCVFAKRELPRTAAIVLITTGFIFAAMFLSELYGVRFLEDIQWAWVPPRFWEWYRHGVVLLFPVLIAFGAGALASYFLKAREISAIVAFAGLTSCLNLYELSFLIRISAHQGRLAAQIPVLQESGLMLAFWLSAVVFYSFGCLWIRWHRRPGDAVGRR